MRLSYFKIGLFVIVATLLVLVAIVVFGSGILTEEKIYFETYFDESVSGLRVGSPVEFRGVRIGQVEKVAFISDEYELPQESSLVFKYSSYIIVLCSVPRENLPELSYEKRVTQLNQMVTSGLRVQLASNLLTGQAYLQGNFVDPNRNPLLKIIWEPKRLYVPSAPSTFTTMKDSVDTIMYKLQEIEINKLAASVENILNSLDSVITEAKIGDIGKEARELLAQTRMKVEKLDVEKLGEAAQQALTSVNQAVADANVPALSKELRNLIVEVRQTNKNLQVLLASPEPVSGQSNLPETIVQLNNTLVRIDKLISTERPQIEMILANFKEISDNLSSLTNNLKKHPSDLLFSKPPSQSEAMK
jgi:phospholipid/cholesterol/gamma-HCH transport system substrate-binding protein/paraquat-inducible protein B